MKAKLHIRFVSGREESYKIEFWGGPGVRDRLNEFVASPDIVLRTEDDIVVIPATAIEQVTVSLPESKQAREYLSDVRRAQRIECDGGGEPSAKPKP